MELIMVQEEAKNALSSFGEAGTTGIDRLVSFSVGKV